MQLEFFEGLANEQAVKLLEGFRYREDFISPSDEAKLIARFRELPFENFDFHGFKGKRRVVSFGWRYDYSGSRLRKADDIPAFLLPLRAKAAAVAEMPPAEFQQVLVTEYAPGAGIGWHRDKAVFGQVIGISLLSTCVLRFRRKAETITSLKRSKEWERVNVVAAPRSAYLLSGPARLAWEHSILRVDALRYSITFRNVQV